MRRWVRQPAAEVVGPRLVTSTRCDSKLGLERHDLGAHLSHHPPMRIALTDFCLLLEGGGSRLSPQRAGLAVLIPPHHIQPGMGGSRSYNATMYMTTPPAEVTLGRFVAYA